MKSHLPNVSVRLASALVALGLGITSCVAAAEGFYIGAGVGQTKISDVECDPETVADAFDISCSADDTDTAFKLFGGYKLPLAQGSAFSGAIEIGFVDFGEVGLSGTDSVFGATSATVAVTGFNLALVGTFGVTDRLSLLGKLGMLRWDADIEFSSSVGGSASDGETGTDFAFGIGAILALTDQVSARLEWERFKFDEDDADLLSASLLFAF